MLLKSTPSHPQEKRPVGLIRVQLGAVSLPPPHCSDKGATVRCRPCRAVTSPLLHTLVKEVQPYGLLLALLVGIWKVGFLQFPLSLLSQIGHNHIQNLSTSHSLCLSLSSEVMLPLQLEQCEQIIEGALPWYSKCCCAASVTKTCKLKGVQTIHRSICQTTNSCTPLSFFLSLQFYCY
jgi:hypothetical protein